MTHRIAVFDLESDGLLDEATRLWCAVVIDLESNKEYIFTPDNIADLLSTLESFDVLVGHNVIGYDFPLLRKLYGWEYKGEKVDTVLISRTQRPNRLSPPHCPNKYAPHSVEAWGYRLGDYKLEHTDWTQYSPEMLQRCIQDTRLNVKIYHALLEEGKGEGWENAHKLNAKLFHYLQLQEEYGFPFDNELAIKHIATLDRWIDRIDKVINPRLPLVVEVNENKVEGEYNYVKKPFTKTGSLSAISQRFLDNIFRDDPSLIGGPFSRVEFRSVDLDSNAEVKDFLLALGWEPDSWNTNNEGKRTSPKFSKDENFKGISKGIGRLIAKRVQCRARKSIIEGWQASIRNDGRISARVTGVASTGRAKHSGIVNVPNPNSGAFFAKQMRQLFIAKPGWSLVGVDSKSNQVRQLAACMNDPDFTAVVLDPKGDIHESNRIRSGVAHRSLAKNIYYGFTFGAGDAKIGKLIKGGAKEGRELKDKFLEGLPLFKAMLEKMTGEWRASAKRRIGKWGRVQYYDGYIRGLDGRPILVEDEHTVLVYHLQSMEAIQLATAYVWFFKDMEKAGYKYKKDFGVVVWMHDEWQTECRPEIAEHVGKIAAECIAKAGRFYNISVPHEGGYNIGKNWYECH